MGRLYGDFEERALARLDIGEGCWNWLGCVNSDGYGRVRIGGVSQFVHRAMMEWKVGRKLDRAEVVDHLCRNKACARPSHLEVVTSAENTRRGWTARLHWVTVAKIRAARKEGQTLKQIGRAFDIHYTHVLKICNGTRWGYDIGNENPRHMENAAKTRKAKNPQQSLF